MHCQIGPVQLQIEHTADVRLRRMPDDTKLDTKWCELSLTMICIWSPWATATNTAARRPPAPFDPLGVTVSNLKDTLLQRGQQITITIGPDRVIQAPINDQNGFPYDADPAGGPHVHEVDVREVPGDKSAIVRIRLTVAYNADNHAVVSHRWTVRSMTDGRTRLSSRVIEGWAVLRMDFLNAFVAQGQPRIVPDQLRAAFIQAEPHGFMRRKIHVEATPDGQRLHYVVVDQQQWRNLGARSAATRVRGDATAGVDWPFKEVKGVLRAMGEAIGGLFDALDGRLGRAAGAWSTLIPTAKARVVCRVEGHAQAELADLVNIGIICCLDRFAPLSIGDNTLLPVSVYVSDDMDNEAGPRVQVKAEFLPINLAAAKAMFNPKSVGGMMNLKGDVALPGPAGATVLSRNPAFGNPRLPASFGTRGHWVSFLVSQVLANNAVPVGSTPVDGAPARLEISQII